LVLRNSTFRNNTATGKGGALIVSTLGSLEITDSIFEGNSVAAPDGFEESATPNGGAVWVNDGADVTIDNTQIENNSAGFKGGALAVGEASYNPSSTKQITITDSQFLENTALNNGGAIHIEGDSIVVGESSYKTSSVTIGQSTFSENSSGNNGGAITVEYADVIDISDSTFSDNIAGYRAGAIHFYDNISTTQIENSTFDGNQASAYASAIYWGKPRGDSNYIRHSTFTDNQLVPEPEATAAVGALYMWQITYGNFEIDHSIFSGNNYGQAVITTSQYTIDPVALTHSLLDDQTNTTDDPYVLDGTNLLGGDGMAVLDAELHPLADNGGATLTRYPMDNSPVIDAGNEFIASAPEVDQRGSSREIDTIDIGAVEHKNLPPEIIRSTWSVETGTAFSFDLADYISDPDNNSLVFTVTEKPVWITFGGSGSTASGTVGSIGSYPLSVSVSDGNGFELDVTILITVTEAIQVPEQTPEPDSNPETDEPKKKGGSLGVLTALLSMGLFFRRRK
jgi:predicted outer membrane repeat protein